MDDQNEHNNQPASNGAVSEFLENFRGLQRLKTDVFRDQVPYSSVIKEKLEKARKEGVNAVKAVESDLGELSKNEAGVIIDLMLSYRAVKAYQEMVKVINSMPLQLADTTMVQEQLGFVLNRLGKREEAIQVLSEVIKKHGPSSETNSLLGRVYKDKWEDAVKQGNNAIAQGNLQNAIEAYLAGFESDRRDAFPGVNAVTLMEIQEPADERRIYILPEVVKAVEARIASGEADYWDHASLMELSVLARNESQARESLSKALTLVRESWEPESTARNLQFIRKARQKRNDHSTEWIKGLVKALEAKSISINK